MSGFSLLIEVMLSSIMGTSVGFLTGLVPGLHMNNIAALTTVYASAIVGFFGIFSDPSSATLLVACFIGAAMVAHIFSEAVTSTFVGVPSEDVVSVLPAHRLARAGLGSVAVIAAADGALVGVLIAALTVIPVSVAMAEPIGLYGWMKKGMLALVLSLSGLLVLASAREPGTRGERSVKLLTSLVIFLASGVIGTAALDTCYSASRVPDFPWMVNGFVSKPSLLLPMFAGFFGVPGLLLSLESRVILEMPVHSFQGDANAPRTTDLVRAFAGGIMVGWLPGMTSGTTTSLLSPRRSDGEAAENLAGSLRFIWTYSSITASGAVLSVGALLVIMRARSGSMDAIGFFLGPAAETADWSTRAGTMLLIVLAMILSAIASHSVIRSCARLTAVARRTANSKRVIVSALVFVVSLSAALTGVRGMLLMATCASIGLIVPLAGQRRMLLMGSLLVPIILVYAGIG